MKFVYGQRLTGRAVDLEARHDLRELRRGARRPAVCALVQRHAALCGVRLKRYACSSAACRDIGVAVLCNAGHGNAGYVLEAAARFKRPCTIKIAGDAQRLRLFQNELAAAGQAAQRGRCHLGKRQCRVVYGHVCSCVELGDRCRAVVYGQGLHAREPQHARAQRVIHRHRHLPAVHRIYRSDGIRVCLDAH